MIKKIFIFFIFSIFVCNCATKHEDIIDNNDLTMTVIRYNKNSTDSLIKWKPVYCKVEVSGKPKQNLVYIRWGRSNNPINVGKDWDKINIGDYIVIKESRYPKYKVEYIQYINKTSGN